MICLDSINQRYLKTCWCLFSTLSISPCAAVTRWAATHHRAGRIQSSPLTFLLQAASAFSTSVSSPRGEAGSRLLTQQHPVGKLLHALDPNPHLTLQAVVERWGCSKTNQAQNTGKLLTCALLPCLPTATPVAWSSTIKGEEPRGQV